MVRSRTDKLLLGEWACLGILADKPTHGFAIARRLSPTGDVGRIWSLSRPLTYRALAQLEARHLVTPLGEEPGTAGGNRTIYGLSPAGQQALHQWLAQPVTHLRDVRSELLLKLELCTLAQVDPAPLITAQQEVSEPVARKWASEIRRGDDDPVTLWRYESSRAVVRFLQRLASSQA